MRHPWANLALLGLLLLQTITGYYGMTSGREPEAWLLWLHGIGSYALLILLLFKGVVIWDAIRRKNRWTRDRVIFLVTLVLLLITTGLGLIWTLDGPRYLGGFSFVSLHIYIAVPVMALMLWHAWKMRFIRRVRGAADRRLFLNSALLALAGLVVWRSAASLKAWAGLPGASRRFTGSYEVGSWTGRFPSVSWIADRPRPVAADSWRLRIVGAVEREIELTYGELVSRPQVQADAALDCTGGWYTLQRWQGVTVGELLDMASPMAAAASVTFESVTGYKRRFDIVAARDFLLGLGMVIDETYTPLGHAHGFPVRLVAPGERGLEWVKWLASIQVNTTEAWLQSPLPLQ